MKTGSNKRNYLFAGLGGLSAVLLSASYSPAFAYTDPAGVTCSLSQTVSTTFDGSPVLLCQSDFTPNVQGAPAPTLTKMAKDRLAAYFAAGNGGGLPWDNFRAAQGRQTII
jgi:hypothetical protein